MSQDFMATLIETVKENIRLKKLALIYFIIENVEANIRLRNIKFYLLKERVSCDGYTSEEIMYVTELYSNNQTTPLIKVLSGSVLEPIRNYSKLTNSIVKILKSNNLSDNDKIDEISDLLL